MRHGGQILVDQLAREGVSRVFSVPGESFLAALDGLVGSGIEMVTARQEGGAAMMAEADGKLTGRPGVCFVTRGPGATNASAGVHVAMHDSTPLVLFVGQVGGDAKGRGAFQELDLPAVFAPLAKAAFEIDRVERIPEFVSRAFHVAQAGRPGPVVVGLPETMLSSAADVANVAAAHPAVPKAAADDVAAVVAALRGAERPLVVVGGPGWSIAAADALRRFAEGADVPVAVAFRRQDYLDSRSPCAVGDLGVSAAPSLLRAVREADVILAVGTRLGEIATQGYDLLAVPEPVQRLVHVHPDPDEIGRVYRPALGVVSASAPFLDALAAAWEGGPGPWGAWRRAAREGYEAWRRPRETPGAVKLEQVIGSLAERLPEDAILTNGAGNYAAWVHRYYPFRGYQTQLAPTSGSMGYGLPAAIAAKLRHPERAVVAMAGDGCFQMTCQEFGTAVEVGAAVVVIVCDNGQYGTIRMHQERHYPGRVSGTQLKNPDFARWAQSYGAFGATVDATEEFAPALEAALGAGGPALLHLKLDPEALSPGLTLADLAPGR